MYENTGEVMKYWAYINNVVCGPYPKEKLAEIPSFSLASLLCPDAPGGAQADGWKAASAFPEVLSLFGTAPAPEQPAGPAQDRSRIMMTMRGTLIDEPIMEEPAAAPVVPQPSETPAVATPEKVKPVPGQAADPGPDQHPERLSQKLEQMSEMLVSIGKAQAQLLDRMSRVESAVADMKGLLFPAPPK